MDLVSANKKRLILLPRMQDLFVLVLAQNFRTKIVKSIHLMIYFLQQIRQCVFKVIESKGYIPLGFRSGGHII
jgi:hypothetical protein